MTKQEFRNIIQGLKSVYVQTDFLSDVEIIKWYDLLHNYDYLQMQKAVFNHIRENKQPPIPSDLIESYNKLTASDLQEHIKIVTENAESIQKNLLEKKKDLKAISTESKEKLKKDLKEYSNYFNLFDIFLLYGLKKIDRLEAYIYEYKHSEDQEANIYLKEWKQRALEEFHKTYEGNKIKELEAEINNLSLKLLYETTKKKRFINKLNEETIL